MSRTSHLSTRNGVFAAALLALAWSPPVLAQDVTSTKPVTSSALLPLPDGSIFTVQPGPCMPQADVVSLTGNLHVVTLVRQGMLTEVHLNLAGVQGIGQPTGNLYIGTGAQKFSNLAVPTPTGQNTTVEFSPTFMLEHTDGCAADTPQVNVDLDIGPGGELTARSVISAGWANGPALSGLAPDATLPAGGLRAVAVELPAAD